MTEAPSRGAPRRRAAHGWIAACALVAAVGACGASAVPERAVAQNVGGGTMSTTVTTLGEVGPKKEGGPVSRSRVDPTPVALWSGGAPRVVLRYELEFE